MEMAVQGGQRCDKATGKMSFFDSPTIPISVYLVWHSKAPVIQYTAYVLIYGAADIQNKSGL